MWWRNKTSGHHGSMGLKDVTFKRTWFKATGKSQPEILLNTPRHHEWIGNLFWGGCFTIYMNTDPQRSHQVYRGQARSVVITYRIWWQHTHHHRCLWVLIKGYSNCDQQRKGQLYDECIFPSLSSLKPILYSQYPETEWEEGTLKSIFFLTSTFV